MPPREVNASEWTGVNGKRILITGATSGIGLAGACALVARGARLAIVARSEARARDAIAMILATSGAAAPIDIFVADLASQASIRQLAGEVLARYPRLDVLINNAGAASAKRQLSEDGLELTWAVNHLAPFLLSTLLRGRLRDNAPTRIITTASNAYKGAHVPFDDFDGERAYRARGAQRYRQTKLANILFTAELARRLEGISYGGRAGASVNCFHPGSVATRRDSDGGMLTSTATRITRPLLRSPREDAKTMVWLADALAVSGESGGYFVDNRRVIPSPEARDVHAAKRLWGVSEEQVRQSATGERAERTSTFISDP
jgi:NAD(P)-dependent dehydrogenase (short-subunit alcohol dehydrogenase family)